MTSDKPIVNYFLLRHRSADDQFGGTGIFMLSRLNYLRSITDHIQLRVVPVRDADPFKSTVLARIATLIVYIFRELRLLLCQPKGIYYLVYPKIPLVAYGVTVWTWPFVLVGYTLLRIRQKLTGTRIIVEIEDLPIERNRLGVSLSVPDLSTCTWYHLSWNERLYTVLEWVIFHGADRILQPSQPFSEHVAAKFRLPLARMNLYRREIYMPTYESESQIGQLPGLRGVNFFYSSGNLSKGLHGHNVKLVVDAFANLPNAALYICGREGEWIKARCRARNQSNVHYLGLLSYADHDTAARQCQVGLLLYAHSYADFKCTAKYPAYIANGLAVLSTDLLTLSQIIEEDGVGKALPMSELVAELRCWVEQPEIVKAYRQQSQSIASRYLDGSYMGEWIIPEIRLVHKEG